MDSYTPLLRSVLTHLGAVGEEMGLDSLALPGVTNLAKNNVSGAYELVSFLVVR